MDLAALRAELSRFDHLPGDTPVVMANSAEGHGFSPLRVVDDSFYVPGSPYAGEWYANAAFRAANPDTEVDDAPATAVPAVFFWPSS